MDWDTVCAAPEDPALAEETGYRLYYFSFMRPSFREFVMPESVPYRVEVIDTWGMTVTDAGVHSGRFRIPLPGRPYMAVRMRKA